MKAWYYISSWQKPQSTWGSTSTQWKQVGAIGPVKMTYFEASVWAKTEVAQHGQGTLVKLYHWNGSQWMDIEPADPGSIPVY